MLVPDRKQQHSGREQYVLHSHTVRAIVILCYSGTETTATLGPTKLAAMDRQLFHTGLEQRVDNFVGRLSALASRLSYTVTTIPMCPFKPWEGP